MHHQFIIQLGAEPPMLDLEAFDCLEPLPGKVAVEMAAPITKRLSGIEVPESVADRDRSDIGSVMAVGAPYTRQDGSQVRTRLCPGDVVLVRPYDGMELDGLIANGYCTQNPVRITGLAVVSASLETLTDGQCHGGENETEHVEWWDSIPAKWFAGTAHPLGHMVKVRRDKEESPILKAKVYSDDDGTTHVAEWEEYKRTCTVLMAGEEAWPRPMMRLIGPEKDDAWLRIGEEGEEWLVPDFELEEAVVNA
jgi:co-chaperonin GroES (HSP10)